MESEPDEVDGCKFTPSYWGEKKQTREEMKTRKEPYLVVIEPYF